MLAISCRDLECIYQGGDCVNTFWVAVVRYLRFISFWLMRRKLPIIWIGGRRYFDLLVARSDFAYVQISVS